MFTLQAGYPNSTITSADTFNTYSDARRYAEWLKKATGCLWVRIIRS